LEMQRASGNLPHVPVHRISLGFGVACTFPLGFGDNHTFSARCKYGKV
jgi:hypothetical protein